MGPAWTGGTMLADADRRPKFYYDLSLSRYPKRKAKQRDKNQFSHFLLLRLHEQVYGRREEADPGAFTRSKCHISRFCSPMLLSALPRRLSRRNSRKTPGTTQAELKLPQTVLL
jgi:hypothetical protein